MLSIAISIEGDSLDDLLKVTSNVSDGCIVWWFDRVCWVKINDYGGDHDRYKWLDIRLGEGEGVMVVEVTVVDCFASVRFLCVAIILSVIASLASL